MFLIIDKGYCAAASRFTAVYVTSKTALLGYDTVIFISPYIFTLTYVFIYQATFVVRYFNQSMIPLLSSFIYSRHYFLLFPFLSFLIYES